MLLFLLIGTMATTSFAQSDYTQDLLQNRRYEVRAQNQSEVRRPASAATTLISNEKKAPVEPPVAKEVPAPKTPQVVPPPVSESPEPRLGEQLGALYGEGHDKVLEFYDQRMDPRDPRRNKVSVLVAPGWAYSESRSIYSPRDYHTSYPEMNLRAQVWLTPAIGLAGHLQFSMGASIPGDNSIPSRDPIRNEAIEVGFRFRHFQGFGMMAPSHEIGIFFLDDSTSVSPDSTTHPRLRSGGLGLGLWSRRPVSDGRAFWNMNGGLVPRISHSEGATGWTGASGVSHENIRLFGEFSREEILSRKTQVLFGVRWVGERNSFDGVATATDPVSGKIPTNVSVTQSKTTFFFGYRWGN